MELFEQDTYLIEVPGSSDASIASAMLVLYQPILGGTAVLLYGILMLEGQKQSYPHKHSRLCKLMGVEIEEIEAARIKLEQFNLLKTFQKKEDYLYRLRLPLSAGDFLNHYVYGVQYKKRLGINDYEISKEKYVAAAIDAHGYKDVSARFDPNLITNISTKDVEEFISIKANDVRSDNNLGFPKEFDYSRFVSELSELTFPRKLRTTENMRLIAQLATVYGISAERMRVLACRSIDIKQGMLDSDGLIARARRERPTVIEGRLEGYQLPPLMFLQEKQPGTAVSLSSKRILEYLVNDTPFQTEVINFLIEFALENSKNILNQKYVEKIAETFARSNVKTLDDAKQLAKRLSRSTKEQEMRQAKIKESTEKPTVEQRSDPGNLEKIKEQLKQKLEKLG